MYSSVQAITLDAVERVSACVIAVEVGAITVLVAYLAVTLVVAMRLQRRREGARDTRGVTGRLGRKLWNLFLIQRADKDCQPPPDQER